MHAPTHCHYSCLKRILRYLKGTLHHGLFLRTSPNLNLSTFTDSYWAGDLDDQTSTSAYVIYLGGNPVSWKSSKQRTVARSSIETEYKAIAHATSELI